VPHFRLVGRFLGGSQHSWW